MKSYVRIIRGLWRERVVCKKMNNISHRKSVRAIVLHEDKLLSMHRKKFGKEYYTLIGGGVDLGEELETALRRELREETGVEVDNVRLVFVEDGGELFGTQYVYLCDYKSGSVALDPDTEEAKITAMGQNIYEPVWLPVLYLPRVSFRSQSVAQAVLDGIENGWPAEPKYLEWKAEK